MITRQRVTAAVRQENQVAGLRDLQRRPRGLDAHLPALDEVYVRGAGRHAYLPR
jgi:hypothetical protein